MDGFHVTWPIFSASLYALLHETTRSAAPANSDDEVDMHNTSCFGPLASPHHAVREDAAARSVLFIVIQLLCRLQLLRVIKSSIHHMISG
jgi:hypothetical protein